MVASGRFAKIGSKSVRGLRIDVELEIDKATAAWVKDRVWHDTQQSKRVKNGGLRMTLSVADIRELVGWVLSFGSGVKVLQPKSLAVKVAEEAPRIVAQTE